VIIDHSVLEIFANGQALTARIYPTRHDALTTDLAVPAGNEAAPVCVERFEAWTVDSIWEDPRQLWPESD
jgi:beta-fructofuranosidase